MSGINTGYGTKLPYWALVNLYVIYIITSIPGLAISPIMGDLTKIFPGTSQLETRLFHLKIVGFYNPIDLEAFY